MMEGREARRGQCTSSGFSLLEIVAVLLILGLLTLFGTRVLMTMTRGYVLARSSGAVVQKAQMALQRMSNDFSYITTISACTPNRISYNAFHDMESHVISQSGTTITYTVNGTPYVLADSVAPNGLRFSYFNTFNAAPATSCSTTSTNIIGISLTMQGDGMTKTFTTRVTKSKSEF